MNKKILSNNDIAELLRDVAAVYQMLDESRYKFQIIAYQRAADSVEKLSSTVKDYWDDGKLNEIPGVGKSIAEHLDELFKKGESSHFRDMLSRAPRAMFSLMRVPGLGPKKAFKLASAFELGDKDPIGELKKLAKNGKLRDMEGFGEDSEKLILQSIDEYERKPSERILLNEATDVSERLMKWMKSSSSVLQVSTLGSLRRQCSTVGDIDIAVATDSPEVVMDHFVAFPETERVIERGQHSASIIVKGLFQVDLMVQPSNCFGSLLQHFTGSKQHNVMLREYALKRGLSLSEYGIRPLKEGSRLAFGTFNEKESIYQFSHEKDFYEALGLGFVPPELREGLGEISLAEKGKLPELVTLDDVKGDLHMHSSFDIETSHDVGADSMENMCELAISLGYQYIAFTEHNPSQKGHTEKQVGELLARKQEKILKLNEKLAKRNFKAFNSLEIDILPDGSLPVRDNAMSFLDFALVSIHSSFRQPKASMTKRILKALSHPQVRIFAHPTARILNKREGIDTDWGQIFEYMAKNNKWIEINGEPHRLDLPDVLVKVAKASGVLVSFGTDSHAKEGLSNMKYSISVARRGFLSKEQCINTRTLREFEKLVYTTSIRR